MAFCKNQFQNKRVDAKRFEPDLNCGKETYNDIAKADLFFENKSAFIYQ